MENAVINNPCPPNFTYLVIGKIDGYPFTVPFLVSAEVYAYLHSLDWAVLHRNSFVEYVVYEDGKEVGKYISHPHSSTLN